MPALFSARRFWALQLFVAIVFLIVGYQLVQLGVIRRPALLELAEKQHRLKIEIPPLRGQILDRNGKEFATNLKVPSIYAIPRLVESEEKIELSRRVSRILGLDFDFVKERLSRDKAFVWLKRRTHNEDAEKIRQLKSPTLGTLEEYRRFYPQGDLLAQVLGFANVDNRGVEGIELALNRELQGRAGKRTTRRDALGREIKAFEVKTIPAVNGNRITLTIDQHLQYLTERALDRAFMQWKAKGAWAVVMEAKTGKIFAIANRPTFDPNRYESSSSETRRNRAITDTYEPGSVFKIVTASAVLNENKATPETQFNCENGEYHYGGGRVLHDVHAYGRLSFEDVIVKSSNIGTVKIAARLEPKVLYDYIKRFGFGRATGIDLVGEVSGVARPVAEWSKTSPYNIPIGQEISVTTLQMTTAMAVIANGGNLVKPYVISRIENSAGVVIREKKPVVHSAVIRPEVAAVMRRILVRAVEEGTGKKAKIEGIPVGGKTGTAQKTLAHGKGYSHGNFMSSFIGFAPADDPEFVMAVVLDDPKPLYYGGTVAAPVFKEVMEGGLFSMGYVSQDVKPLDSAKTKRSEAAQGNPPTLLPAQATGTKF